LQNLRILGRIVVISRWPNNGPPHVREELLGLLTIPTRQAGELEVIIN